MITHLVGPIDPVVLARGPLAEVVVLEPELDLVLGRLHSVAAVDNVAANLEIER